MSMLGTTVLQLLHWMEMRVALALMPEADTTMPGILTRRETTSALSSRRLAARPSENSIT